MYYLLTPQWDAASPSSSAVEEGEGQPPPPPPLVNPLPHYKREDN